MPSPFGPPVLPRLYLHPDAAGGWLPSGDPVDAGTMHHLSHNLSLMCLESHRHLVADIGPGKMPRHGSTYTGNGWDGGYTDSVTSASTDLNYANHAIAWDRRTARSYHLPAMIADRELPGGGYGLRIIEVEIDVYVAVDNTLQLFAALTPAYQTPDAGALAISTWSEWSTSTFQGKVNTAPDGLPAGRQTVRMWLECKTPAGPPWSQWKCRDSGLTASAANMVYEGHLWVGWRSSNANNAIISIDAWEVPAPLSPPVDTAYNGTASGSLRFWIRADTNQNTLAPISLDATLIGVWMNLAYAKNTASPFEPNNISGSGSEIDASGVGGHPALKVNGNDYALCESIAGSVGLSQTLGDCTLFAVFVVRSNNSYGTRSVFNFPPGGASPTPGGVGIVGYGGDWGFYAEDVTSGFVGTTLTLNKAYILCGVADSTDVYLYVNGIQVGTIARPATGPATSLYAFIGSRTYPSIDADGAFDLSEALMYDKAMTTNERAFVLEYLNRRYGVF